MQRYALVSVKNDTAEAVARYLPDNYRIIGTGIVYANPIDDYPDERYFVDCVVVQGEDNCGWTMDDYVLPRLQSGMIACREIDLSHPVMKKIPA